MLFVFYRIVFFKIIFYHIVHIVFFTIVHIGGLPVLCALSRQVGTSCENPYVNYVVKTKKHPYVVNISRNQPAHHFPMHIRQSVPSSQVFVNQFFMIQSHQMQGRRLKIMDMHGI